MDLVVATRNNGKQQEFAELIETLGGGIKVLSLANFPGLVNPEEIGSTFRDNALIKARAAAAATSRWALGDDSGLCVDALGGRPGIYSARYAEGTDQTRWQKLLSEMKDVPVERRSAAFVCALALCGPGGEMFFTEGRCEGTIALGPRGDAGFGYDPVLFIKGDSQGRTMAELSSAEKHAISHRGRAFDAMRPHLARVAGTQR